MSRRVLLVALVSTALVLPSAPARAGIPVSWTTTTGRLLEGVAVDAHENSYATGWEDAPEPGGRAVLVKHSPSGTEIWRHTWQPPAAYVSQGLAVAVSPGGAVFWGGYLNPGCEGGGWFVQRVRADGHVVWTRDQDGWQDCAVATRLTDLDVGGGLLAFSMYDYGCCGDPFRDGRVRVLRLDGRLAWEADVEPPAGTPHAYYDTATGVAVGNLGSVYVAGWAATEPILDTLGGGYAGIAMMQKVSPGGAVLWRQKLLRIPRMDTEVAVDVRGDQLMVATQLRGRRLNWGAGNPPEARLARLTLNGNLLWWRSWGTTQGYAALPAQVSIDPSGATWVVGTRADASDGGTDLLVRRYGPGGGVLDAAVWDGPTRFLHGTGVAALDGGPMLTGWVGTQGWDNVKAGRLWRLAT